MNRTMFIGIDLYYSQEFVDDIISELQQKENIIKEVRDILNTQLAFTRSYQSAMSIIEEAKSILDKENKYE